MMREAESHADEDKKRKEEIETRNQADQAVYAGGADAQGCRRQAAGGRPAADRVGDRGPEEGDREERRRRDEARHGGAATRRSTRRPRRCIKNAERRGAGRRGCRRPAGRRAPRGGGSRGRAATSSTRKSSRKRRSKAQGLEVGDQVSLGDRRARALSLSQPWISTSCSASTPGASAGGHQAGVSAAGAAVSPGINPGDRAAEAMFRRIAEAYETLVDPERRRQYDAAGAAGAASAGDATFEFAGFDFSVAAHGPQAATFTELFAEVLHPAPAADDGRPEPGADIHARVTRAVRGRDARRRAAGRRDAAGCRAARAAARARCATAGGAVRAVPGHAARSAGRAATWCSSKSCAACDGTGRQRSQRVRRRAPATGATCAAKRWPCAMPAGRRRRRAAARRRSAATPGGTAAGPAISM